MNQKGAIEEAERCKALMKIGRWKINTWENIGWHWDLISDTGYLRIFPCSGLGKYFSSLANSPQGVGTPAYLHVGESFEDPNEAVIAQIRELQLFLSDTAKIAAQVLKIFNRREESKNEANKE